MRVLVRSIGRYKNFYQTNFIRVSSCKDFYNIIDIIIDILLHHQQPLYLNNMRTTASQEIVKDIGFKSKILHIVLMKRG